MSDQSPVLRGHVPPSGEHGWRTAVMQRLEELVRLKPGWDGYGGQPVSLANAVFALVMLEAACPAETPAPQIVPGPAGDLQIEWHTLDQDIELHVRAAYDVEAWRARAGGDADGETIELGGDFAVLAEWMKELTEGERAAGSAAA
jgi:hypothetical protein